MILGGVAGSQIARSGDACDVRIEPARHHPLADELSDQQLDHFLADVRTLVGRAVAALPPHHEFVARHCGMPAPATA